MYIKYSNSLFLFFMFLNNLIYCINGNNPEGKLILNINKNLHKSYNISLHPALSYKYLLKYNYTLYQRDKNIFANKNNDYFSLYFLDNEDSIINLLLNKSTDSLLSSNYLIITHKNISKTVVESLSYQMFYINEYNYNAIDKYLNKNILNLSINLLYDNTDNLIPYQYIYFSKCLPFLSTLFLLLINKIIFSRNKYYNLCLNSSILRLIYSFIYFCLIYEKLNYNKIKYEYISGLSVDFLIDSLNNFVNDIYLSFVITSIIFIINNETNIINFFNSDERKIKIYFFIFLLLSIINIPNYLFNQNETTLKLNLLYIKLFLFDIFKTFILICLVKKHNNIISIIIYFYSTLHLVNGYRILIIKQIFLKIIKIFSYIILALSILLDNIIFKEYKNNEYYWKIIEKCTTENYSSIYLFIFWILLNISEESNPLIELYYNKVNSNKNMSKYLKFNIKNEITHDYFQKYKNNIDKSILNHAPVIILHPLMKTIDNNNFDKIALGMVD